MAETQADELTRGELRHVATHAPAHVIEPAVDEAYDELSYELAHDLSKSAFTPEEARNSLTEDGDELLEKFDNLDCPETHPHTEFWDSLSRMTPPTGGYLKSYYTRFLRRNIGVDVDDVEFEAHPDVHYDHTDVAEYFLHQWALMTEKHLRKQQEQSILSPKEYLHYMSRSPAASDRLGPDHKAIVKAAEDKVEKAKRTIMLDPDVVPHNSKDDIVIGR